MAERLAKVLAKSDLGLSRREAERVVGAGRVHVNGEKIFSPALNVGDGDALLVDGKAVTFHGTKSVQVYVANKLERELVTRGDDPKGRVTMSERLKQGKGLKKLVDTLCFVGRLDYNSEGLILLTNDGELARRLEHPSSGLERRYRVRVHGSVPDWKLEAFRRGATVKGVRYKPMEASVEVGSAKKRAAAGAAQAAVPRKKGVYKGKAGKENDSERGKGGSNVWLQITCTEGKNRQIRRVCESLGLKVSRLIRTHFGGYDLTGCQRGGLLKVDPKKALLALNRAEVAALNPEVAERAKRRKSFVPVAGVDAA